MFYDYFAVQLILMWLFIYISNGDQMSYQGSISCKDNQASALVLKIDATHYFLFLLLGQGKLIMFCRFNI